MDGIKLPQARAKRIIVQGSKTQQIVSTQNSEEPKPQKHQAQRSYNIQNLIRNKQYSSHRQLMADYLKRMNIPANVKVFCFNSQDEHIRRVLLQHNWYENSNGASQIFDLKWIYNDIIDEFKTLLEGQFYNHFKNTKQLTTKQCLLVNFKGYDEYGVIHKKSILFQIDTSQFFPRAFDLGNLNDRDDFIREYEKTTAQVVLKKHIKYIKTRRPQLYQGLKQLEQKLITKKLQEKQNNRKFKFTKNVYRKFKKQYQPLQFASDLVEKDFKFNLLLMCQLVSRLSDMKHQLEQGFFEENQNRASLKLFQGQSVQNFIIQNRLLELSKIDNMYDEIDQPEFKTPNNHILKKLIKYHLCHKRLDQSYTTDGIENLWIIKPSGNARGQGIYLEVDMQEAIDSGKQMQARLIQKYIERPLLFQQYKFDLRQWVLVRSFQPLKAYMFSHCYMRMCSQLYNLKDYKNAFRHLTNFSLNKNQFQEQIDSINNLETLIQYLESQGKSWEQEVKPQIKQVIINTLKCVQGQFENESKFCKQFYSYKIFEGFEVFGFDILLDYKARPWLLEVNLSPACTERAPWLSEMLEEMTEGMLNIVIGDEFRPCNNEFKWECIYQEEQISLPNGNQEVFLEIEGQKINPKKEKVLEKKYFEFLQGLFIFIFIVRATVTMQKFFRMFLARRQLLFLRHTKHSIIIQKNARRYLAKNELIRRKRNKCALQIQVFSNKNYRTLVSYKGIYFQKKASAIKIIKKCNKNSECLQNGNSEEIEKVFSD